MAVTLGAIAVMAFVAPIPQDPAYHCFADQRSMLGIPHFWNVVSNLPFLVVGILGVFCLRNDDINLPKELEAATWVFFVGVALVSFGSSYYHWRPVNETLAWDRLPMTPAFMAFFCIVFGDRVSLGLSRRMLWPLIVIGALSVAYWHWSETQGHGDLRPYALVQFLPILLIFMILFMFPEGRLKTRWLWMVVACYAASKICEHFDSEIHELTGHLMSGHPIKHVFAAIGCACFLPAVRR